MTDKPVVNVDLWEKRLPDLWRRHFDIISPSGMVQAIEWCEKQGYLFECDDGEEIYFTLNGICCDRIQSIKEHGIVKAVLLAGQSVKEVPSE